MPASRKFVLSPGTATLVSVLAHGAFGLPAGRKLTWTAPARVGGALYRATSGFAVGVTTGSVPVTREFTASLTMADVVSVAVKPSLTVTWTSYVPSCMGAQVTALVVLKS